jgi:hypothetical protein
LLVTSTSPAHRYNGLGGTTVDGKLHVGFIAQEVPPALVPYCRRSASVRLRPEDECLTSIYLLDHSALPFVLTNAAREHELRIGQLEGQLEKRLGQEQQREQDSEADSEADDSEVDEEGGLVGGASGRSASSAALGARARTLSRLGVQPATIGALLVLIGAYAWRLFAPDDAGRTRRKVTSIGSAGILFALMAAYAAFFHEKRRGRVARALTERSRLFLTPLLATSAAILLGRTYVAWDLRPAGEPLLYGDAYEYMDLHVHVT